jgi:malate/lactate dehydrogenase
MPFVAVIGSGPLGGSVAHTIARRDRVSEVRLIDPDGTSARGKALDMLQSAPIDLFSTRVTAAESIDAAAGADAVVIADAMSGAEHAEGWRCCGVSCAAGCQRQSCWPAPLRVISSCARSTS